MVRVGFLPLYGPNGASSRQRILQFVSPLRQAGLKCSVLPAPERRLWRRLWYLPRLWALAVGHDVLFVQKRALPGWVLGPLRLAHRRIVYDLDDAVYLRPALRAGVDRMLRTASVVIAGNKVLGAYASQLSARVVVVPTVVDTQLYAPPLSGRHPGDDRVIVGWTGTDPNRGDFARMRPVLDWLGTQYGEHVALRTMGRRGLEMETRVRQEFVPWSLTSSLAELQQFDIGIMPLQDTEWNRGKCGFKLVEYMAVGAAAVASLVGANREIVRHGETGYLAATVEEWCLYLGRLIEDEALRERVGREGRRRVEQVYSVQSVLPVLMKALATAASG